MLHDENYKRLFASPLMVQDVLRACLPAHRLATADLSSLGELSPEYVSDELRTRHGDTVWHLRLGRRRAFLLVLLEFQAQDDRLMALRILTYTGLLLVGVAADDLPYRNLLRALARLEQSRSPEDVMRAVTALRRWLPKRGAEELRRAFADWLCQIAAPLAPPGALVPAIRTLEEASMTLVERVAEWPKQWLREGREQGVAEGREQGLTQGVDQQRALLCRQAAARFDADAAARLADLLAPIADPERLAEVGDWLVRCETASAFFARFDPASPS